MMSEIGKTGIPEFHYQKRTSEGFYECMDLVIPDADAETERENKYVFVTGDFKKNTEEKPFWQTEDTGTEWELRPDSYAIEIGKKGIYLEAYTERGFFYGLLRLKKWKKQYGGKLPFVNVLDWADTKIRCDYLEFRNFYPKLENVLDYLEDMAERHINAVLVEMEDKRPFLNPELKKLQNPKNGFTREEVTLLEEKARELYMEWIPLQQSFGHLEYVLKNPEYMKLRELPESAGELCPSNPDSTELVKTLLEDINRLFPESKYLHLGCDEVWSLLKCDRCSSSGLTPVQMFIKYVNPLIDFVCKMGKIPLLWHDMLAEGTVEELRELDKRAIVIVWMYDGNNLKMRASRFIERMKEAGISIWGACAVRCWDKSGFQNYPVLGNRKNNVIQWSEVCRTYHLEGMVNTNWSAYSALAYPYGIYETSIYPATFAACKSWNFESREEEFLGNYIWEYHGIDPQKILEEGMKFEDYYYVAAELKKQAEKQNLIWEEREADWYRVIEDYENATQGDFPAVLQMFRVAKFPERAEEWDSMRQRYITTFTSLKKLYPKMKKILEKYMEKELAEVYLYAKFYLWDLYEKEILKMAEEAGQTGFYPILTMWQNR